ncbi:BTB/POZ domain-containing protein KCTD21 [Strongylocentrotus purpuratus]|uniref:BTB domain-containing protein n=1 Tax=Strongylocentrotus purpuratus TaxID=7668 RepID=A0A7M7N6F9_STRPU|nr:BTB/POZ domain-containing protein KCTD21 [Strongylocentrotus purpuratus]
MADLKPGDFVTLSVGGVPYTTTVLTLTSFSDSMLEGMFSGRNEAKLDEVKGHYLIDRDGELFRYVLNFLRNRTLGIPEDFKQLHMLLLEAEFYQIGPMCEAIRELLQKPDPEVIEVEVRSFQDFDDWKGGTWSKAETISYEKILEKWKIDGQNETLRKVPCLVSIIDNLHASSTPPSSRGTEYDILRLEVLERAYRQHAYTPEEFNRLKLFQEIGRLGFSLKATETHWPRPIQNYYQAKWQQWIFTRV